MIPAIPRESDVAENIMLFCGDIFTANDALRIVQCNVIDKPPAVRMLCWLICFDIIPGDRIKWMRSIMDLIRRYHRLASHHLAEFYNDPPNAILRMPQSIVRTAVDEAMPRFEQLADELLIPREKRGDAKLIIERIIAIAINDIPSFMFAPYHVHLVIASVLLPLALQTLGNLNNIFTETIGYYLTLKFLGMAGFNKDLKDKEMDTGFREDLVKLMEIEALDSLYALHEANMTLTAKVELWDELFFTDFHHADDMYLILDQIIYHRDEFRKYFRCLIVAHFHQAELMHADVTRDDLGMEGRWCVPELVIDTENLLVKKYESLGSKVLATACPCFPFFKRFFM